MQDDLEDCGEVDLTVKVNFEGEGFEFECFLYFDFHYVHILAYINLWCQVFTSVAISLI
jgi:hypothetical protein